MPSYQVQFSSGNDVSDSALNASSLPALAERLAENGCVLRRVSPARPDRSLGGYWRRVGDGEMCTLLRQIAVSLDNGVPVAEALALQARETRNHTLRPILMDIERSIRSGDSLSSALVRYPRLFTPVYTRLLEAGEAGSRLPQVLRDLADYAERASQASLRIRTSLVYPQVVGIFTFCVMLLTFIFVVPKFIELFRELGVKEFPWVTTSLLWASSAVLPALLIGVPVVALGLWALYARSERHAVFRLAHLKTRIPVLGALYYQFALLRLTRLLAALLTGGVPLLEALRLAGQGADSALLQAAMWDAIPRVAAGESLAASFSHSGILPPTFIGQIAAAEAGGNLPEALTRLAVWYSDRVDYLAARVGAMLEPFFILFLAGMAGWIAFGVFFPLVAIIQALSGGGSY